MEKLLLFIIKKFPKGSIWQTRYICLPAAIVFSTIALMNPSLAVGSRVLWFIFGLGVWTFLEYVLHRWILHWNPKNFIFHAIIKRLHIFHHEDPSDQTQVCIPFILSGSFWILVYGVAIYFFGAHHVKGFLVISAIFLMMTVYDIAHYSAHYMPAYQSWVKFLKKHHMLHHFSDHTKRFGVTSPLWDYVFGTL